jgi:hypothetical protein
MNTILPTVIVFDLGSILSTAPHQWKSFTTVGDCYVPAFVLHELEELALSGLESRQQDLAQKFERFYANSGWRLTNIVASHDTLSPAPGHDISKRSRLGLAAAQAAYGIARRHPKKQVVFVSDSQAELRRIAGLEQVNLCGLPVSAMIQWGRSQHKPEALIHHARIMFEEAERTGIPLISHRPIPEYNPPKLARHSRSPWIAQMRSGLANLFGLGLVLIAMLATWRIFSPHSFQQFWRSSPVSQLPHSLPPSGNP